MKISTSTLDAIAESREELEWSAVTVNFTRRGKIEAAVNKSQLYSIGHSEAVEELDQLYTDHSRDSVLDWLENHFEEHDYAE